MLYKVSSTVNEIPQLFCQLDELSHTIVNTNPNNVTIVNTNQSNDYECWREKARWIRFEEQAEDVTGRWSKPHVAALPQTSIHDLKELIRKDSILMFDVPLTDIKEIADAIANELITYFDEIANARRFAEIMCLPHIHHHEKKCRRSLSGNNLLKVSSSNNFQDLNIKRDSVISNVHNSAISLLKYQYSFTDGIALEELSSNHDFKENIKMKKKVHRRAEGASILVAPISFAQKAKFVFLRLDAATDLPGFIEVKLKSRFIIIVMGPTDAHIQLYEIGRVIATCLADDVCKEHLYAARTKDDLLNAINLFNRSTMLIPASEWDPRIRIDPPEKYLSKEERKAVPVLTKYIHDEENTTHSEGHAQDPNLEGSIRAFSGLLKDMKRKMRYYSSDITDSFNLQCVAAMLYLYLVSLCSLVTFGALLGKYTKHDMGIVECVLAGSISGVVFALVSGQPLNVLSATGPMLILEGIIHRLCDRYSFDYMEFRLWTGLWTMLILLLFVMFNLSFLVKYITRFTEECFASLVAILFVIDAFKSLFHIYKEYPVQFTSKFFKYDYRNECTCISLMSNITFENSTSDQTGFEKCLESNGTIDCQSSLNKQFIPDIFLFSVILFVFTYALCMSLKGFRNKNYLPSKARQIVSDFSVLIAILAMCIFDSAFGLKTPKLTVPSDFTPTKPDRPWIVPFFSGKNQWWTIPLAVLPAIVTTILVFMDQHITGVIVNRKEFKLKKSSGYHMDLLAVALTIGACSILGAPWFVAATVLALTHVNALKIMSENTAPGEKPQFLGVREQRMTSFLTALLIGLSIFFTSFLKYIPMPVLYAVFLFMGVSALNGMQFVDRIRILFIPTKYQPDYAFLKHVNTKRVHLFTIIQFLSTAGLYIVKSIEAVSITFPILIVATCGIRKLLEFIFTSRELYWLDDLLPSRNKKQIKGSQDAELSDPINNSSLDNSKDHLSIVKPNKRNLINALNSTERTSEHDVMLETTKEENINETNETVINDDSASKNDNSKVKFCTHFTDIQEDESSSKSNV